MISTLQANYNSRLAKMYLVNVSFGIMFIWKIVSAFINPVTRGKIKVFSSNNPKELLEDIHPSQLPRAYGGEYDPPNKAWPPAFPPQSYCDEYKTQHFTPEEFKAELLKNKEAVPSPEMAKEMKGLLKGKRVPQKTYYLANGKNQIRDQFNCIIEPASKPTMQKSVEPIKKEESKEINAKPIVSKLVENDQEDKIIEEAAKNNEKPTIQETIQKQELAKEPVNHLSKPADPIKNEQREMIQLSEKQESKSKLIDPNEGIKLEFATPLKLDTERELPKTKQAEKNKDLQNINEVQGGSSTSLSGRQEIQLHNFDKARATDTMKYKKTKSCCDSCLIL